MSQNRMYLSKASVLHTCLRKYYFTYELQLQRKEEPKAFKIGRIFHEAAKENFEHNVSKAVKCISTSDLDPSDVELVLNMFSVLRDKFEGGDPELVLPITILGTEQPIFIYIGGWKWYIKTDLTFIDGNKDLWKGDYKTTSGYGSSTASFYHNSPQTWVYQAVLSKHFDKLKGSKYFIVTKTKEPKCTIETILLEKSRIEQATRIMQETVGLAKKCKEEKYYPRQGTQCKAITHSCPYLDLCFHFDPVRQLSEPGANMAYVQEVLQLYEQRDPDEHLGLEE